MLIIPMWLRLSFHEKYRVNRYKTFYYSPTTDWWWYFQDYEIFRFRLDFVLENRSNMQAALDYLRKEYDPEGKWSKRIDARYNYAKYGCSLLEVADDWPDLRVNTMLWKTLQYIHQYSHMHWSWYDQDTRQASGYGKKGHLFERYHWYLDSYSRSKKKVLGVEGVYKLNARLYWRKVVCTRVGNTDRFRYRRYQWAFWDFDTKNIGDPIVGHCPSYWSREFDIDTYIPSEEDSNETVRLKRNMLFLIDDPENPPTTENP